MRLLIDGKRVRKQVITGYYLMIGMRKTWKHSFAETEIILPLSFGVPVMKYASKVVPS
jgi:hypothetical protein